MRIAAFVACGVVLLAAGCGGSKHATAETSTRQTTATLHGGGQIILQSASVQPGLAGVPAAALPGITVVGTAEQTAKPDRALVGLTIGSSNIGSSGQTVDLVEQSAIDPVVAALSKAGAAQISTDRFGQGLYGQGAAEIGLTLTHPEDVDKVIATAQEALRKHTDYDLQSANVVFALSDCPAVEQTARKAALADAATRAQGLADLSGVKLGNILAVSEAPLSLLPYAALAGGCEALRPPAGANALFPSATENTQDKVTVSVTLQVTYAVTTR
jgi:uncharacterized protein YggE